jgi:hypothetical protein
LRVHRRPRPLGQKASREFRIKPLGASPSTLGRGSTRRDYEAREFWARVVPNLIAVAAVFTSAILVAYFSLHQGWIFVMAGPLWFGLELLLRLIAIAAGDKPDPRWAIDYRLEPVEAADGGVD